MNTCWASSWFDQSLLESLFGDTLVLEWFHSGYSGICSWDAEVIIKWLLMNIVGNLKE